MDPNQNQFKEEEGNNDFPWGLPGTGSSGPGGEDHFAMQNVDNQLYHSIEIPSDQALSQASIIHGQPLSAFSNINDQSVFQDQLHSENGTVNWQHLGGTIDPSGGYPSMQNILDLPQDAHSVPGVNSGLSPTLLDNHLDFSNPFEDQHLSWTPDMVPPYLTYSSTNPSGQTIALDEASFSVPYPSLQQPPPLQHSPHHVESHASNSPRFMDHVASSVSDQTVDYGTNQLSAQVLKRRPGRPRGGELSKSELLSRVPGQDKVHVMGNNVGFLASSITGGDRFRGLDCLQHNPEDGPVPDTPSESTTTNKKKRARTTRQANLKPSTTTTSDTSTFLEKRPDMTDEQLQEIEDHNFRIIKARTDSERVRNNMSAKRGRYKRMACTIAIADEVLRLRIELQRAHEELFREKIRNGQLAKQLETLGIDTLPVDPPSTPASVLSGVANAGHGLLNMQAIMQHGVYGPARGFAEQLTGLGRVYGPDGNGKFHMPSDHLALEEQWSSRAEDTRKELIRDLETNKISALQGGCAEQMEAVIARGDQIRTLQSHSNVQEGKEDVLDVTRQPRQTSIPNSLKRKSRTPVDTDEAYLDQDGDLDDQSGPRKSLRLSY